MSDDSKLPADADVTKPKPLTKAEEIKAKAKAKALAVQAAAAADAQATQAAEASRPNTLGLAIRDSGSLGYKKDNLRELKATVEAFEEITRADDEYQAELDKQEKEAAARKLIADKTLKNSNDVAAKLRVALADVETLKDKKSPTTHDIAAIVRLNLEISQLGTHLSLAQQELIQIQSERINGTENNTQANTRTQASLFGACVLSQTNLLNFGVSKAEENLLHTERTMLEHQHARGSKPLNAEAQRQSHHFRPTKAKTETVGNGFIRELITIDESKRTEPDKSNLANIHAICDSKKSLSKEQIISLKDLILLRLAKLHAGEWIPYNCVVNGKVQDHLKQIGEIFNSSLKAADAGEVESGRIYRAFSRTCLHCVAEQKEEAKYDKVRARLMSSGPQSE